MNRGADGLSSTVGYPSKAYLLEDIAVISPSVDSRVRENLTSVNYNELKKIKLVFWLLDGAFWNGKSSGFA